MTVSVAGLFGPDKEERPNPPVKAFRTLCGPGIPERKLAGSIEFIIEAVRGSFQLRSLLSVVTMESTDTAMAKLKYRRLQQESLSKDEVKQMTCL